MRGRRRSWDWRARDAPHGPAAALSHTVHHQRLHRTADTFRRNGRVKRAHLETEGGYKTTITLKDTREPQRFRIPTNESRWIKLTIAEVYPGSSGSDTCLTWLSVDHEELNN